MLLVQHPRLVEKGAHHVAIVQHDIDVAGDEASQILGGGPSGGESSISRILEETRPFLDDLDEEVLFGIDMGIERGSEHPQLAAQVAHGGPLIAALGEQPAGGGDDIATTVAGRDHQRWSYLTTTLSVIGWD